jgi:hypothetical protein
MVLGVLKPKGWRFRMLKTLKTFALISRPVASPRMPPRPNRLESDRSMLR